MVGELHLRGYQRLRAFPYMAPSGMHWRCLIIPSSAVSATNGMTLADGAAAQGATYSSGDGGQPFGWTDAATTTPSGLARRFLERFPEISRAGLGTDWQYAGWYGWMLHLTYPAALPYFQADWNVDTRHGIPATGINAESIRIPLPPAGHAI